MDLSDLLQVGAVLADVNANSKKLVMQEMAVRAAEITGRSEREIFDTLIQREKLGATGVGHGVAIPHGKLPGLPGLVGVFARIEKPVDFEAFDGEPVDLIFMLLAPENAGADHLKALARIARALRDRGLAAKLRASHDADAVYMLLTQPVTSDAA
jgi:nitrogen PTS system EIIA component